jgi:hypothetical protein
VVATVETARARKSITHELKIDNSLYSDQQVRSHVTLLWEATYKAFPPSSHGHAVAYSNAKEAVSALPRDLTRKKKQILFPTTKVCRELAQLGLILGARGPRPALMAQKEALLKKLETLEGARKRSSQAAYNASQYEECMTKQFFSQFKGGFSNTDISTLHSVLDWDSPDVKGDEVLAVETQIVDEFARYYTHFSRPRPSANSKPY